MVYDMLNQAVLKMASEDLKDGMAILDVGCGTGRLVKELKSRFNVIAHGIEFDQESVKMAEKYFDQITSLDLEDVIRGVSKFESSIKFDYIIFGDILEHTTQPATVVKVFKNYLKENGIIIISLPNVVNWMIRFKFLLGKFNPDGGILDKNHLRFFTLSTAKKFIQDCGLDILTIRNNNMSRTFSLLGRIWKSLFAFQFVFKCKLTK